MDYTGKAGAGKRYLDENGNFIPISKLPKEVQIEIQENSRAASKRAMEKRLKDKGFEKSEDVKLESDKLLSIIEKQSELIAKLEAKLDKDSEPEVVVEPEVKLTPKQQLQKECDDLGIAYTESDTIKDLKKLIEAETMEVVEADDERYPDVDPE